MSKSLLNKSNQGNNSIYLYLDEAIYHANPSKNQNKFSDMPKNSLKYSASNKNIQSGIINITEPEKIFIWDRWNADELMIEGKNKLKLEIQWIENNKDKNVMLYRDMAQLETKFIETVEEEVISFSL